MVIVQGARRGTSTVRIQGHVVSPKSMPNREAHHGPIDMKRCEFPELN